MITLKESILGSMGMGDKVVYPKMICGVLKDVLDYINEELPGTGAKPIRNPYLNNVNNQYQVKLIGLKKQNMEDFIDYLQSLLKKKFKDNKYVFVDKLQKNNDGQPIVYVRIGKKPESQSARDTHIQLNIYPYAEEDDGDIHYSGDLDIDLWVDDEFVKDFKKLYKL